MPKYDDIINLERPASKYDKMPIEKRASIFSPFAALTGFTDKIKNVEKDKDSKIILSDDMKNNLDLKLKSINKNNKVTIKYFHNDNYIETNGFIKKIDRIKRLIILENKEQISFDDIIDINT